jgi:predicted secreted protein
MWAIKTPKGKLMYETLSDDKEGAYWLLFNYMSDEFISFYWKKPELSRKQYTKLKYKSVKVKLVEIK